MTEDVNRSMLDCDKRSYAKPSKSLSKDLDGDTLEFLKVHQSPMTVMQLELVCLFGQTQSPNATDNTKTLLSPTVESVLEIYRVSSRV